MRRVAAFTVAALLALGCYPVIAQAHPRLMPSTPAANAAVAFSNPIELRFSESVIAKLSGADIVMTSMPGMKSMKPMTIAGLAPKVGPDGKTLAIFARFPLERGNDRLSWHAVSADTHRVEDCFDFTVR